MHITRTYGVNRDISNDPAGIRAKHDNPVGHFHGFRDIVRHHHHRTDTTMLPAYTQHLLTQALRRHHIKRRERLIHEQRLRLQHQARAMPTL